MVMNLSRGCWYTTEYQNRSSDVQVFANDIAVISINILAIVLSVFANGFVVYTYLRSRSTQPISNTLLFLLATFDLLQGIVSQPVFVATKALELHGIFNCHVLVLSNAVGATVGGFSFIMVTFVVTSERLFAIVYPIQHRVYMRRRRIVAVSLFLFVFWVTLALSVFYNNSIFISNVLYLSIFPLGLIHSLAVYIKIYCVIRKSVDFVASKRTTGLKNQHDTNYVRHTSTISTEISETKMRLTMAIEQGRVHCTCNAENELDPKLPENSQHQNNALEIAEVRPTEQQGSGTNAMITNLPSNETITVVSTDNCCDNEKKNPNRKEKLHNKNYRQQIQSVVEKNSVLNRKEKRTIVRMLCILGALYICNIPTLCFFILSLEGFKFVLTKYLFPWSLTFYFSSTIVNPFIYCYRNEHFWNRKSKKSASLPKR